MEAYCTFKLIHNPLHRYFILYAGQRGSSGAPAAERILGRVKAASAGLLRRAPNRGGHAACFGSGFFYFKHFVLGIPIQFTFKKPHKNSSKRAGRRIGGSANSNDE